MIAPGQGDNDSGDTGELSFEQIHRKYQPEVYGFILRSVGNEQDAEDLTLETFVNAYRAWDESPDDAYVLTWLHRIAIRNIEEKKPGE